MHFYTHLCFIYSFWNFDALFQPQQHPARDAHDTFYLKGLWTCFLVLLHPDSFYLLKKNLVSFWLSLVIHMQFLPPQRNCLKIMLRGWSVFMSLVVMGPGGMTFSFIFLFSYLSWISLHFFPHLQIWLWLEQRRSKQKPSANAHNCCFIQDALHAGPGVILFKCLTFNARV